MRTANTTVLAQASKEVLGIVKPVLEEHDLEGLQFDFDSITILLTEFNASQLAHDNVQWVLWHLLEHVLMDVYGSSEELPDEAQGGLWDNMDAYISELEASLQKRDVKVSCPRLEALLHEYWMEAEEASGGKSPVAGAPEPKKGKPYETHDSHPCVSCGKVLPDADLFECEECGLPVCDSQDCASEGDGGGVICRKCEESDEDRMEPDGGAEPGRTSPDM